MKNKIIGNYIVYSNGRVFSKKLNRFKEPYANGSGYMQLRVNGTQYFIHRLIASLFLKNPQNKKEVNHKNGIKTDNRVENLEWCTRTENVRHSFKNGLSKMGTGNKNPNAKLNWEDVSMIRELKNKLSNRKIADKFHVGHSTIAGILNNKTWIVQL